MRTAYLRGVNAAGKTMVSVGAAGRWYFDWVHENSGHPHRHIGLELYVPKPDDLPPNVEWVANTAGDMSGVEIDAADIVFSEQNIEHLWEEDVTNFLPESNRVLKPGGLLVIDSPNRIVTAALNFIHPEHMVEPTPDEAIEILAAASFDLVSARGIYLSRDPRGGGFLPYETRHLSEGPWSLIERCTFADSHVDHSLISWIEASKSDRLPDPVRTRELVRRIWEIGWPERMRRFRTEIGELRRDEDRQYYVSARGSTGAVIYGPYAPIQAGRYRATLRVSIDGEPDRAPAAETAPRSLWSKRRVDQPAADPIVGRIDVMLGLDIVAGADILAASLAPGEHRVVAIEFTSTLDTAFGWQCRLFANGTCGLSVERHVDLVRID